MPDRLRYCFGAPHGTEQPIGEMDGLGGVRRILDIDGSDEIVPISIE